jgi:hypothetical protein
MLRAFVDESGTAGRDGIFVMAGLVAFAVKWDEFVESWSSAVSPCPFYRTASYKDPAWCATNNVGDPVGQTEKLARLITYPPLLFSVCCTVQKGEYREIVTNSGALRKAGRLGKLWLKTPYAYCLHNIVALTLEKIVNKLGIRGDVVDFVFDRNDPLFDAANQMFRELRNSMKEESWRSTLGDVASGNDERLGPLQAADLLAGRLKDYCGNPKDPKLRTDLLAVSGVDRNNVTRHIRSAKLEQLAHSLQAGRP